MFLRIFSLFCLFPTLAFANAPKEWQIGFQKSVSPLADRIFGLHDIITYLMFAVLLFVSILLAYTCWRFRAAKNNSPSTTDHNILIEIIWIVIPVIIITIIAIPSVKLIYYQDTVPKSEFTLKVTGRQWYWTYEYPDHGEFSYDSNMIEEKDLKEGDLRLL